MAGARADIDPNGPSAVDDSRIYTKEDGDMSLRYQYDPWEVALDDAHDRMLELTYAETPCGQGQKAVRFEDEMCEKLLEDVAVEDYARLMNTPITPETLSVVESMSAGVVGWAACEGPTALPRPISPSTKPRQEVLQERR